MNQTNYFDARKVQQNIYKNFKIPKYLIPFIPKNKSAYILDFGCGLGQMMNAFINYGFTNVYGCDVEQVALEYCQKSGLKVENCADLDDFVQKFRGQFDLIIMSHVLEHISKDKIIETLSKIKELLTNDGGIFIMVPNAQSPVGCYWAYEDFTHTTLFTSGSLYYVLKMAGFNNIELVDPLCLEGLSLKGKLIMKLLYKIYDFKQELWNYMTASSFHKQSPKVYSWEIKMYATK